MNNALVKTYFPHLRLAALAGRAGGTTRASAIENAMLALSVMREEGDATIVETIGAMEGILGEAPDGRIGKDVLQSLLTCADQLVTLAAMFNYESLDQAARSFCDLLEAFFESGDGDAAPLVIHLRALHLMAPGSEPLSGESGRTVLEELARLRHHYGATG
ncbi:MAG: hypothetical protein GC166_07180 [Alphaproteobacteria bacterium]|nr:hypothetical protein [Alphaproteobacteria bacterium]